MHHRTKVVAAYLDGRRLKGFLYDFSAVRGYFFLFPEHDGETQPGSHGLLVRLSELKALFFVKEFTGNPGYKEQVRDHISCAGEKVEVIFADGETRIGFTESLRPGSLGFFLTPTDPQSNNEQVFVVSHNIRHVRVLAPLATAQHA
jgi:hypothetical protein